MAVTTRRLASIAALLVAASFILALYISGARDRSWQDLSQHVGMGEWAAAAHEPPATPPKVVYEPGTPKPPGANYTRTLVMPRVKKDDVSWLAELPADIEQAVYVADDARAPLHPPKNKGHEAMVYLTYIIDHYDALPDVAIFMHAHRKAWHNAELFDLDAVRMLARLSPARVAREGYVNLRCQWYPGCPAWLHPGATAEDGEKAEEVLVARAWAELFPFSPVPRVLAQPCCAQFALSRQRMLAIPRQTYVYYRDWLLHTPLRDSMSGRIWEYLWQFVFAGRTEWCPDEHVCSCDAFGVCFASAAEYADWWAARDERDQINARWLDWEDKGRQYDAAVAAGRDPVAERLERPTPGMAEIFNAKIEQKQERMDALLADALRRGDDPAVRASVAGRPWKPGDGF